MGISQQALASLIGSTRDIIASWERGRTRVTANGWEKVERSLVAIAKTAKHFGTLDIRDLLVMVILPTHVENVNNT